MHKPLGYHKSRSWRLDNHLVIFWLIWSKIASKKLPSLAIFVGKKHENICTWQFFVPFLEWLSDPFKGLSDLQLGDEKGTLNHLVYRIPNRSKVWMWTTEKKSKQLTDRRSQMEEIRKTLKKLHPWKLTCPLKSDYSSREYIFNHRFFRGHVSFQGSMVCCLGISNCWWCSLKPTVNPIRCLPYRLVSQIFSWGW